MDQTNSCPSYSFSLAERTCLFMQRWRSTKREKGVLDRLLTEKEGAKLVNLRVVCSALVGEGGVLGHKVANRHG